MSFAEFPDILRLVAPGQIIRGISTYTLLSSGVGGDEVGGVSGSMAKSDQ